jgi:Glycosyltransferase
MTPKVLILQSILSSYNIPAYREIAKQFDLTVGYVEKIEVDATKLAFNTIKFAYKKLFGLFFIKAGLYKICSQYDVVIYLADLHHVSFCLLPFLPRRFKVIPWTIGIRASYTKRYNVARKKDLIDYVYGGVLKQSDASIFYMKEPIQFWGDFLDKKRIFVAHNTVEVLNEIPQTNEKRHSILFVGTLYKEKKIYELISAYIEAKNKYSQADFLKLEIIGKGEEFDKIKKLIEDEHLKDSIFLHGPIYDEEILSKFFAKSLICVSPNQAGLSVLKSMGYGVPYVTRIDAITGGERFNIVNNQNGILYSSQVELTSIIEDVYQHPDKYIHMGLCARNYYIGNATIEKMAQGALDAINFVLN